jgi:hypothetical protein
LEQVYKAEAKPVEDIFRQAGVLQDFHITGGIPETFPRLLGVLRARSPGLPALRQQQQREEKQAA